MKKIFCLFLLLAALTSKAEAHYTNYYYGISGGINWNRYDHNHFKYEMKNGFVGFINAGLNLCYDFRFEGEFSYRFNKIKHLHYKPLDKNIIDRGKSQQWALIGNFIYDFKYFNRFTPFVGVGAGYAIQKISLSNEFFDFDHDKRGFAWQGIAGVKYLLCPNWELLFQYRYLRGPRDNMWSQSATVGFNWWIN